MNGDRMESDPLGDLISAVDQYQMNAKWVAVAIEADVDALVGEGFTREEAIDIAKERWKTA